MINRFIQWNTNGTQYDSFDLLDRLSDFLPFSKVLSFSWSSSNAWVSHYQSPWEREKSRIVAEKYRDIYMKYAQQTQLLRG